MPMTFANADLLISAGRCDQFPALPLPQAVFSGRSNVGKSTLLNKLCNNKNAINNNYHIAERNVRDYSCKHRRNRAYRRNAERGQF